LAAAAGANQLEAIQVLLKAGAPIEAADYRGDTALIKATTGAQVEAVRALLAAGADPNRGGFMGTPLGRLALASASERTVEVVGALLESGARLDARGRGRSKRQTALERILDDVARNGGEPERSRWQREVLLALAPSAGRAEPLIRKMVVRIEGSLQRMRKRAAQELAPYTRLASRDELRKAGWATRVKQRLRSLDRAAQRREVELTCTHILSSPAAIAHPKWSHLIEHVIGLSWTYADVTKRVYGRRLSFDDLEADEGGAMDVYDDDHLYTFDWVLEILAQEAAIAHPRWAALVLQICHAKAEAVSYYSFGDDEIETLLALKSVRAHRSYRKIVRAARSAFPYASCFSRPHPLL
jgi:hypothetical protein